MNDHEAQRIAAAMHELRPDWPVQSLLTLLRKQLADKPRRDVAVALAWVACESASHTPARVLETGPWWRAAGVEGTATAKMLFDPETCCTICAKPDDGRHPQDHGFQSEHDRRRQLGHEAETEAERIKAAIDWARQGIGDAKAEQPERPTPEPLPSVPEVDRLRMLVGAKGVPSSSRESSGGTAGTETAAEGETSVQPGAIRRDTPASPADESEVA